MKKINAAKKFNKVIVGGAALLMSSAAFAADGDTDIIGQLMGAVDTSTLLTTVAALGVVVVGVKFGEKGITFVKRLIGKI